MKLLRFFGALVAFVSTVETNFAASPTFDTVTATTVVATTTLTAPSSFTLAIGKVTGMSANVVTLLGAADYAAFRTSLGLGTLATQSGTFSGTSSGTNTGDQASVTGNAGTATILATGRTIGITGDLTYTSPSFNGSANVTAAGTLATVNSNTGALGGSTAIPTITTNAKGLVTAVTTNAVIAPAGTLAGATLASGVTTSSLTSIGTLGSLNVSGTAMIGEVDISASGSLLFSGSSFGHRIAHTNSATITDRTITWTFPDSDATYTWPSSSATLLATNGSGASLTALNASNISSGTLADARNTVSNSTTTGLTGAALAITPSSAGTLNNIVIGGNTPLAGTFTTATATTRTVAGSATVVNRALQTTDYLVVANPSGVSTDRSTIRFGQGGFAAPSAANADSTGDKIVFANGAGGKSAIGVSNDYGIWFQGRSGGDGFVFYGGTTALCTIGPTTASFSSTITTTTFSGTTESTTTGTGAIVTPGGIGVAKNATIGGTIAVTGTSTLTGTTIHGAATRLKVYTVATLPASPTTGDSAAVSDALTPAFLTTIVGGGSTYAPVTYNGSNWVGF